MKRYRVVISVKYSVGGKKYFRYSNAIMEATSAKAAVAEYNAFLERTPPFGNEVCKAVSASRVAECF